MNRYPYPDKRVPALQQEWPRTDGTAFTEARSENAAPYWGGTGEYELHNVGKVGISGAQIAGEVVPADQMPTPTESNVVSMAEYLQTKQ